MNARLSRSFLLVALAVMAVSIGGCTKISTRLAMNEGINHYKSKEFEKAATSFKRAITIDPQYADGYLDLGLTYMELYEPGSEHPKDIEYAEGAMQAFRKYIELNPANEKAQEYLINIGNLSHRLPEVIDFFMADYNKNPQDLTIVKKMAALYRMAGDTEKAIEWYEKAAQLEPNNPEAWYSVGVAIWGRSYYSMNLDYDQRMQLLDKGQAALEKAVASKPEYYDAMSWLSLIYREKAKYDISPASAAMWTDKANQLLTKAMEYRNKAMAAQAAAAAQGGARAAEPARSGGE